MEKTVEKSKRISATTLTTLIVALATAGGLIFSIVQYYTNLELNSKVQEESYKSLKYSFELFSTDVKRDLEKITDDTNELRIQIAVANEAIKNLKEIKIGQRSPVSESKSVPVRKLRTQIIELPEFKSIQETAQSQMVDPKL